MTAAKKAPAKRVPKPPARPGDKDYDWSADYPGEEFFVYTTTDGKRTVGLAALGPKRKFKPGDIRKSLHLNEIQQTFMVVEKIASPNALAVSDDFEDGEYKAMMDAWTEWTNTSQGESSAP